MTPIKLTLKNFCQHASYEHVYTPGVSGITGNNAAGKTNFAYVGQQFAITGKTNTDQTKKDFLKWGCSKGSTCFEFIHDSLEYVLTRELHSTKVLLEQGENKWKQTEANDCMTNILGLTPEVFFEVCFVQQGNLWDILNMPHSKRMEYFQKLTDAWQAEGIRDLLDKGLKKIPVYPDRTDVIKGLEESKTTYKNEFDKEESHLQEEIEKLNSNQVAHEKAVETQKIMTEQSYKFSLDSALNALNEIKKTKEGMTTVECPEKVEYPEALVKKESDYNAYQTSLKHYDKINYENEVALKEKFDLVEPHAPTTDKMEQIKKTAEGLKQKLKGVCEACNRPFEGSEDIDREKILNEITSLREEYKAEKDLYDTAQAERERFIRTESRLNLALSSFDQEKELAKLGEKVEYNPDELAKAKAAYSAYDALYVSYKANEELLKTVNLNLAAKEEAYKLALETPFISYEEALEAQQTIDFTKSTEKQIVAIRLEMKGHETNLKNAEISIKVYTDEKETARKAKELRLRFERARLILHRDKLPKVVMSSMLKGINHYMASMLCSFNVSFHAYLNDDFDFIIEWQDEPKPASVLSGGEKVILAISFHIGLARLLTGNIPFMILDEPTNHLDKYNKQLLRDALMALKGEGASGCEYFIVTHDDILQPVFDREIQLGKEA